MGYTPVVLEMTKSGTTGTIYGDGSTTGGILKLFANKQAGLVPNISLTYGAGITLTVGSTLGFGFSDSGLGSILIIKHATPDIEFATFADKNFYLKTSGSGLVKFGTYTADATVTQAGYITVLDNAGVTRYLSCITP